MEIGGGRGQKGLHRTGVEAGRAVRNYFWRWEKMRLIVYTGRIRSQNVVLVT